MENTTDWRSRVRPDDLEHWERVWAREQETARRAEADGMAYRYIPWHEARGDRSLIGKMVSTAYWTHGFGELPWGHHHAHAYAFAFEPVISIGPDFLALEKRGSRHMISYDMICVQERSA
jgi:hypothetical protein